MVDKFLALDLERDDLQTFLQQVVLPARDFLQ